MEQPQLIDFPRIGKSAIGYIGVAEASEHLPFEIKRVFWTYYTPESIVRGRHAHHETEMVLLALSGRILVHTEMPNGHLKSFSLDRPDQGLYMPPLCWHTMQYSHTAVQLVLASTTYKEADYIRDYDTFKTLAADKG